MKINTNKTHLQIIISFIILFTLILYYYVRGNMANHLIINEINFSQNGDADWIEIYNPTLNNLSMENMYLSDKSNNITKFKINQNAVVPSKGYLVIYSDKYSDESNTDIITANFNISANETIYLVATDGKSIIDSLTAIASDQEQTSIIGRYPDGCNNHLSLSIATPGTANQL